MGKYECTYKYRGQHLALVGETSKQDLQPCSLLDGHCKTLQTARKRVQDYPPKLGGSHTKFKRCHHGDAASKLQRGAREGIDGEPQGDAVIFQEDLPNAYFNKLRSFLWVFYNKSRTIFGSLYWAPDFWKLPDP